MNKTMYKKNQQNKMNRTMNKIITKKTMNKKTMNKKKNKNMNKTCQKVERSD